MKGSNSSEKKVFPVSVNPGSMVGGQRAVRFVEPSKQDIHEVFAYLRFIEEQRRAQAGDSQMGGEIIQGFPG
ncbi:hypothetical protein KJ562_02130 [Patescibacteria group bacterium]|nr:hypothetical protein [Patescibacteria group bacterium]